jgi:protein kinase A
MKEMAKARILTKRSVDSVINERIILSELRHPFLVNMYFAFQDRENLYVCLDYMSGGDLRYHINKRKKFTEDQTKFFVGCLL